MRSSAAAGLGAVGALVIGLSPVLVPAHSSDRHDPARHGITLLTSERHQTIDGLGYATAFGRAQLVENLPADQQASLLDLLLARDGAAPSIVRLGISSGASSIEATDPGGPDATPHYTWDGDDSGQVWFSKQAQQRGVTQFYADAWSAPGYMKDTGSESGGGTLCGVPGVTCASGDWRQAYASYLVQFTKFYRDEGIRITDLGFANEPDYTAGYSSMRLTPDQAADFVKVLGPVAHRAGLDVTFVDAFGWTQAQPYADALAADKKAAAQVDVVTGHSYASRSDQPLDTTKKTWMSEWAPSSTKDGWNEAWDSGKVTDGIAVAEHIEDTFAGAGASAYLYWYGVSSGGTAALVQVDPATNTYHVSKRYDAFAAYSRFIRSGAVRIGVSSDAQGVKVSAYRNKDGSTVVELLNLGQSTVSTSVDVGRSATAYLTDSSHGVEATTSVFGTRTAAGSELRLPPRSLVTIVSPK